MKIIKKVLVVLMIFILIPFLQIYFLADFYINSDILDRIITFLSIIFGFYITSLAIFATSRYVSSLYKITDKDNKRVTLLHTLMFNYKFGLKLILISIVYFLVIQFIVNQSSADKIVLSNIWLLPFLSFVLINFFYSYRMLRDLINIIIQEGKINASKS